MNAKKKLAELLDDIGAMCTVEEGPDPNYPDFPGAVIESHEGGDYIADYLIENGVTVQRWIPTTERLPAKEDANKDGEILAVWVGGKVMDPLLRICSGVCSQAWHYVVQNPTWFSHWMSMPEPPEED